MFCSTIIPTIGRATLARAVNSVLSQSFTADNFEIIVVNDSGRPLPYAEWQTSEKVQILDTNRHERSTARNTGAAVAKGAYLHFLDDDDWFLPEALQSFWELAQTDAGDWLYGRTQLIDRAEQPLIQLQHGLHGNCFIQTMAGEWIPLQSSLIKAQTFFEIGGFNPLITGPEDVDLGRRIALNGNFAETEAVVACIGMGEENSSTPHLRHAEYSRWAREKILNQTGVFARMRTSANSSYWHGCMIRIYLTSAVWNLQHKNLFTVLSRLIYGVLAFILSGFAIASPDFWQAITRAYQSKTFSQGFRDMNLTEQGAMQTEYTL